MRDVFLVNNDNRKMADEAPLRAELYSADQMNHYAAGLAKKHVLNKHSIPGHLIVRLSDNEMVLNAVRKLLVEAIKEKKVISPASEWLIDNFYLIEEQIHIAKQHLPKGYSASLPQIVNVAQPATTRVYDIVLKIVSHSDGKIDEERLSSFIRYYQSVVKLKLGELWAIPIMLRLTLIENLRRVGALIAIDRVDLNLADYWAKKIIDISEKHPKNLILVIGDMVKSEPPMVSSFVSEMNRQLQGKGPALASALNWIEQRLNEVGQTTQELVNAEIQKQAVNQVSISNSISSLRLLASIDWRDFVEEHSIVEQTLAKEQADIYSDMDFTTRDNYRHVVENIAKESGRAEQEIAEIAVRLADQNRRNEHPYKHKAHVGYFLIGKGRPQTKREAGVVLSTAEKINMFFCRNRLSVYLGAIFLITGAISTMFLFKAYDDNEFGNWLLVVIGTMLVLSSSQLAITLVNFFSTLIVKPHLLPRMDFSELIPDACSTLVIIPAMLTNRQEIDSLVEALEVRFLANRNKNLHFGLLTDFTDADSETVYDDAALLAYVRHGIEALKAKYEADEKDIFYLFHRPRVWNAADKIWMGYERKRGKLSDLNGLLRGDSLDKFSLVVGDIKKIQLVKYVITLDADTQLPRGSAWKMIATLAHPLNHALYHDKKKRVTEGYGILQPRVTVSLPEPRSSFYTRLHGNEPGIDPYTRATSDVYQDLFDEGSFIGKGIYEVDIFERALKDRFEENRILSHDLLEGCYIRSGLLSDVELFETYPTSYRSDMKRRARWIRGDWQLFFWFLPFIPGADKKLRKNPLSNLSRWKIFDNIRRSLIPIALTTLIILGWTVLRAPIFWTIAVSGIILFPIFVSLVWDAFRKSKDVVFSQHIKVLVYNTRNIIFQTFFSVICLPYEAYVSISAIVRTVWRMTISHRNLLQWNTSSTVERMQKNSLADAYRTMWFAPFLTIAMIAFQSIYAPLDLLSAGPVILLWAFSPLLTWISSQRLPKQTAILTDQQNHFLKILARKTWAFFERLVTEQDNWLPPDNLQQYPVPVVAHRTSPTNIGLSLLANLTAHDFGYLTTNKFLYRTNKTFDTLNKVERYRGHFYNWYNTETLAPLVPKYISTVDSGNLAGHLLTLRQGIFELLHTPIIQPNIFSGLADTLQVLKELIGDRSDDSLSEFSTLLQATIVSRLIDPEKVVHTLNELSNSYKLGLKTFCPDKNSTAEWWADSLSNQLSDLIAELQIFAPWTSWSTAPQKFASALLLPNDISLTTLNNEVDRLMKDIQALLGLDNTTDEQAWLESFSVSLSSTQKQVREQIAIIERLGHQCIGLSDIEWKFLYNPSKHLLSIGYNLVEEECDPGCYDLLASEARLGVFVAIAQGKLPEDSWFALGRQLTNVTGSSILLSWSGSMFEYLMPLLVMPTYENTLLNQTYKANIQRQIDLGRQRGIPWGVSESGYNMVDANANYQYKAFGVPGLGLKRGLEADSVIAPYATALSLMVAPEAACNNLELLRSDGFEGDYGFYEAIDYTPSRLQQGQTHAIVRSFMAHHEGMSLLSIGFLLLDQPMQRRFEAEPQFKATLLLLQERIPKASSFYAHTTHLADFSTPTDGTLVRTITTPDTPIPEVQLLSNGNYHMMLTHAGSGYSRWKDIAITRWREDVTCDNWGTFCYIRDVENGNYWSTSYQPTGVQGKHFSTAFSQGRVDFHNSCDGIDTHTEIVVSPEDDIELRRLKITNRSTTDRIIEITSYAEVVLAQPASDNMQQAFSNLFVQTEILQDQQAVICTRRPRAAGEQPPWMFHSMTMQSMDKVDTSFETDRMKFIGHGNTVANPHAMTGTGPLTNSMGSVLDPIVAIRQQVVLRPGENITFDLIIGIADTRSACESLLEKYQDKHHKDRVFELAWTHSQVVLRQINATEVEEQLFGKLAGSVIYTNTAMRADPSVIVKNKRRQSGLWGYSISGDLPIVLLQVENQNSIELAKALVKAHTYWRLKGLKVDLVIWNEDHDVYRQALQTQIQSLIPNDMVDKPGGIFVRAADQISTEDRILFQTVARVNINGGVKSLSAYLKDDSIEKNKIPYIKLDSSYNPEQTTVPLQSDLMFFNKTGGFSNDGREYIITIDNKNRTPVPWVNVIANPVFGTVISESGQAYTWAENAHEMRLTPWNNDPVTDSAGEVFYMRDEESGHFWSATPLPRGGTSVYIAKHGMGYSTFEHSEDGIYSEMSVYVDSDLPVKYTVLKIRNDSGRPRHLSATGYCEWVLGDLRSKTAMHVITEIDAGKGTIFAKNPFSTEFDDRVAFFCTDEQLRSFTGDRTEFIGRNKSLQNPDGMLRLKLSGKVGVAIDPCAALQVAFELMDGEEKEIIFRLGTGLNEGNAREIADKTRSLQTAYEALNKVKRYWEKTTTVLKIETPDIALNTITNGWLNYQSLSSRLWGRSGFYQSGGAFGFRDQLQDVLSLLYTTPALARQQILLCASHQFEEGDVQHWWHPPSGRGVRTRISDDFLWLPFVTSIYVLHTADTQILDEYQPYLQGRLLNAGEESYYELFEVSGRSATLYVHCVKAIKHGLNFGANGLPLMETGDWNDGMDRVGVEGKGESIWLAFFLYDVLNKFIHIAQIHNDPDFATQCAEEAEKLKIAIDKSGWDGNWYRRAYFDDGSPLGSATNTDCQIDSIAQSWSVLSGAGNTAHAKLAMEVVEQRLVDKDAGIIKLLDPPFDKGSESPGYIKGYVPGVRENGGQYTHAAIWAIMAFAKLGDDKRTWELLQMVNPVNHSDTAYKIAIYKVEPYVLAGDIYSRDPHKGRGGWTWYTGSASWMYQLIIESFIGLCKEGNKLGFKPCLPVEWDSIKVYYRYGETMYHITMQQKKTTGEMAVVIDGLVQDDATVLLADDKKVHDVLVAIYSNSSV